MKCQHCDEEDYFTMFYPRLELFLCRKCIKRIHFRMSAEYCLKIVGELKYRETNIKEIWKYLVPTRKVLGMLHNSELNNKSAVFVIREVLDKGASIPDIKLPDTSKVMKTYEINMGITEEQAKSLINEKDLADFFEAVSWCNFVITEDFKDFGSESEREHDGIITILERIRNRNLKDLHYG